MNANEDWIVVQPAKGSPCTLEPECYRCVQRYPDGSVRVIAGGRMVVVDAGDWTECEE